MQTIIYKKPLISPPPIQSSSTENFLVGDIAHIQPQSIIQPSINQPSNSQLSNQP